MPATDHDLKYIACAAIVPDCGFTATAPTEEDLLKKVVAHAAHDHGITEVTPELLTAVKAAIRIDSPWIGSFPPRKRATRRLPRAPRPGTMLPSKH